MSRKAKQIPDKLDSLVAELQEYKKFNFPTTASTDQLEEDDINQDLESLINSRIKTGQDRMNAAAQKTLDYYNKEIDLMRDNVLRTFNFDAEGRKEHGAKCLFSQVKFETQSSLFAKLLHMKDIMAAYYVALAYLITTCFGEVIREYFATGRLIDGSMLVWAFSSPWYTLQVWLMMVSWSFWIIPLVKMAAKTSPWIWGPMYAMYQLITVIVPCVLVWNSSIGCAGSLGLMWEMTRLHMKQHSYLREKLLWGNGPNKYSNYIPPFVAKNFKLEDLDIPKITMGSYTIEIQRYAYFFCAPTLIYRDSYPKIAAQRRYTKIAILFANWLGAILYTYILFQTCIAPHFRSNFDQPLTLELFLASVMKCCAPATMLLLLLFFGFLHTWLNLWSEILNFGDRRFYTDWWTVTGWGDYYRKWNAVVHHWLSTYMYQDIIRFLPFQLPRFATMLSLFTYSAIFHEIIISVSFRWFYPVMFILFGGPGVVFIYLVKNKNRKWNVFFWTMMFIGNGMMLIMYSRYFYQQEALKA